MNAYPTTFIGKPLALPLASLSEEAQAAAKNLAEKGYEVRAGLNETYAQEVHALTLEPSIKEYCPKDSSERFTDIATAKQWLSQGRIFYVLIYTDAAGDTDTVAGYGWVGPKTSSHVAGGKTTFSVRVSEKHQGKGLAAPFSVCMLEAAALTFDAPNMWLETWQSNGGAVHIYHKLGFVDVDAADDTRPSADGTTVADTRLYMTRPTDAEGVT